MPNSRYWPLDSMPYLPDWCRLLVYPDTCSYPNIENLSHTSDSANLSQYFYEMSFGRLHIIGDVYPKIVVPPHPSDEYGGNVGKVNYDILTYIDTAVVISESGDTLLKGVDFSLYDNWTLGSYEHINEPDGEVDFIIMIYRWLPWPRWSGLAGLPLDPTVIVTYDSLPNGTRVKIIGSWLPRSGVTQHRAYNGMTYTKYLAAHELGHYLLNVGTGFITNFPWLSLMHDRGNAWNAERGMLSWERERLGWIGYSTIDLATIPDSYTITLPDYMTTGIAWRLLVNSSIYYLIENRQGISPHDWAADHGIYIFRVEVENDRPRDVECADGNWIFKLDTLPNGKIKVRRVHADRYSPWDEINWNKIQDGVKYCCRKPFYPEDAIWGDEEDAFDLTFNNVFSPWSNPMARDSFAIEIFSEYDGLYTLRIYKNPVYAAPSKPQNLRYVRYNDHPKLIWDSNDEPDLLGYNVYRKIGSEDWQLIAYHRTDTTYIDYNIDLTPESPWDKEIINYQVTAVDSQYKESVPSYLWLIGERVPKAALSASTKGIYRVMISPNPFIDRLIIRYFVPHAMKVKIEIYDMTGRCVKSIVNNYNKTGIYDSIICDGGEIVPGVYFVKIKFDQHMLTTKIVKVR